MLDQVAPKSYIYIYIRKLNFLESLFWRGFGEVLERDLGYQKSQNSYVLQWFLTATIENSLVFLGFLMILVSRDLSKTSLKTSPKPLQNEGVQKLSLRIYIYI